MLQDSYESGLNMQHSNFVQVWYMWTVCAVRTYDEVARSYLQQTQHSTLTFLLSLLTKLSYVSDFIFQKCLARTHNLTIESAGPSVNFLGLAGRLRSLTRTYALKIFGPFTLRDHAISHYYKGKNQT